MSTSYSYNPIYQARIAATVDSALQQHRRITAIRIDLRMPDGYGYAEFSSAIITRFFESLKAKVAADLNRKQRAWGRSLVCDLKYVWVREFTPSNGKRHFHVLLLLNKDVYHSLGDFDKESGNLAAMIGQAWCSALAVPFPRHQQLANFSRYGVMYVDANHFSFKNQRRRVLSRADYLAKLATKVYGDGERSFGCSR